MKGTIVVCSLRDMVMERLGEEKWGNVLEMSGLQRDTEFLPTEDAPDEVVLRVVDNLCKALDVTVEQVSDAFGEYWAGRYISRVYSHFNILAGTAKDFLLRLNEVHARTAGVMEGAAPPRFVYRWKDAETLLVTYESRWNLMPFFLGLVRGVGKYYGEDVTVNMRSPNKILITFPTEDRTRIKKKGPARFEARLGMRITL